MPLGIIARKVTIATSSDEWDMSHTSHPLATMRAQAAAPAAMLPIHRTRKSLNCNADKNRLLVGFSNKSTAKTYSKLQAIIGPRRVYGS